MKTMMKALVATTLEMIPMMVALVMKMIHLFLLILSMRRHH